MECSPDVQPPAYLRRDDMYNLSSVADPNHKGKIRPFHTLRAQDWPGMETLGLDESQMKAFKLAITKELTIIQGPPGTGEILKSPFVGRMTSLICEWKKMYFTHL